MSGLGDLIEIISDISELFMDQSKMTARKKTVSTEPQHHRVPAHSSNYRIQTDHLQKEEGLPQEGDCDVTHLHINESEKDSKIEVSKSLQAEGASLASDSKNGHQRPVNMLSLDNANIRNAVILSEILSPPLALRRRRYR